MCSVKVKKNEYNSKNWWHGIRIDGAKYFNIIDQQAEDPRDFGFSDDIAHGIYNSSTGMYTAAQIAAYMGFTEIYFIGVDHHFHVSQNNKGEIVVDNTVRDYFSDKYNEDKANPVSYTHLTLPTT